MARWILLGLEDDEVDVISRLVREQRPEEVMVYHPDPDALVLQLALLADLRRVDQLPEPRADDILVATAHGGGRDWVEAWRSVGAKILDPGIAVAYGERGNGHAASGGVGMPGVPGAAIPEITSRETRPAGHHMLRALLRNDPEEEREEGMSEEPPADVDSVEETTVPAETASGATAAEDEGAALLPATGATYGMEEGPAPEIWTSPEATFRYLLDRAGVSSATLWWDGEAQTWVPWLEIGESPRMSSGAVPPAGLEIESRWGRFVLSGVQGRERQFHPAALSRVAEDMALRELESWRRESGRLRTLLPVARGMDLPAWGRWLDEALPTLAPEAALLWAEHGDGWRLCRAWGEGVGQAGELRLPRAIFDATFGPAGPWHSWELLAGLRVVFTAPGSGPRWPLTLRRLNRLVGGESLR